MYDIHTIDFDFRTVHSRNCYSLTNLDLINARCSSEILSYSIDRGYIEEYNSDQQEKTKRRKLLRFFQPDLSQIAFYFVPITIILGVFLFSSMDKQKKKHKKKGKRLI